MKSNSNSKSDSKPTTSSSVSGDNDTKEVQETKITNCFFHQCADSIMAIGAKEYMARKARLAKEEEEEEEEEDKNQQSNVDEEHDDYKVFESYAATA